MSTLIDQHTARILRNQENFPEEPAQNNVVAPPINDTQQTEVQMQHVHNLLNNEEYNDLKYSNIRHYLLRD